jgi:NADH-quinone oxidoreductase subunit H
MNQPINKAFTAVDFALRSPVVLGIAAIVLLTAPIVLIATLWATLAMFGISLGEILKSFLSRQFGFSLLMMGLSLFLIIHLCAACILAERKLSAFTQDRRGPNRVGFWGILQPIADGIKFILKEEIIPTHVDKPIYLLAPAMAFLIALTTFAVIPWAGEITWPWTIDGVQPTVTTQVASLDIGLLYILAVGSMSVYGVVLAGWSSNNKYSFYGGMRAAAQMLSYEVPLGLGLLTLLLVAGSLRPEVMVQQQAESGVWNIFLHPLAFVLVLTSALAECNRAPFDLAECEQELIGGFHTEYSAMKFAMFFLAEYSHMIVAAALLTTVFLGGWAPLPFVGWLAHTDTWWAALLKFGVFWGKVCTLVLFFMLIRWTLPRFRFDQLMRLAWKAMAPAGMLLVVLTGALAAFGAQRNFAYSFTINVVALLAALAFAAFSKSPVTGRQENLPDVRVRPA